MQYTILKLESHLLIKGICCLVNEGQPLYNAMSCLILQVYDSSRKKICKPRTIWFDFQDFPVSKGEKRSELKINSTINVKVY